MFQFSVILTFVSFLFLGGASISFRVRALANKQAWGGKTVPFAIIGIILLVVSLILLYFNYPRSVL